MALSISFEKIFINPDIKSAEFDKKLYEYLTNNDLESLDEFLNKAKELYFREQAIYSAIFIFTLGTVSKEEKETQLCQLQNKEWIKRVKYTDKDLCISTETGEIRAYRLTDILPSLQEDKDIQTSARLGKCHEKALIIPRYLGDIKNYIVTGYVFGPSDKSKYLHSWVELNVDGEDVVIDYTLNALINKDGYYQLQHAIPLNKISNIELRRDEIFLKKLGEIDLKEYLLFRNEIMRDLEKNKRLFNQGR